ncbi:class I SAM-dependent methyltransferase [Geomonas terrae]|nr:class I SAM-dependent methyltransferase [Geomonas terrae]
MSRQKVTEFFDQNVGDYQSKHYGGSVRTFMTVRLEAVLRNVDRLSLSRGAKVLDAGCGPGALVEALARRELWVSGLDVSENMLARTAERMESLGEAYPVSLKQGSIDSLPYSDDSFDLVCSTGVIEYLDTDQLVLQEMYRVLRPGGFLLISVTNAWSPVNSLDFIVEFLKRRHMFLRCFNRIWTRLGKEPVLPRSFRVRRHRPSRFRKSLRQAGFEVLAAEFFHFMPWPRPLDKFFPKATTRLGDKLEQLCKTNLAFLGEGYLVVCTKQKSR